MFASRRRLVVAAGVLMLALASAAAAAAALVRWPGGLGRSYTCCVGYPARVGQPMSVGMGELRSGRRIRIESVRLHGASEGVMLVGAYIHPTGDGGIGVARAFPPTLRRGAMAPAVDATVGANTTLELVVGLRLARPGRFRVRGVDVFYREAWHGLEVRRRVHTGIEVDACAVATRSKRVDCALPNPD